MINAVKLRSDTMEMFEERSRIVVSPKKMIVTSVSSALLKENLCGKAIHRLADDHRQERLLSHRRLRY